MNIVVNTSLAPMGGFVDANGEPLYNTPQALADAINANYAAQGVAARVTTQDTQQYFANPSTPYYVAPKQTVAPVQPATTGTSTNATQQSQVSGESAPLGLSGLEIIIGVIGVGIAIMSMSGGKGKHHAE